MGQALGIGVLEQFSLLHFQALAASASSLFVVTLGDGGGSLGDEIPWIEATIEEQTIVVTPAAIEISAAPALLSDGSVGDDKFTVTVVFGATMDVGATPMLEFNPDVTGGSATLTFASGTWSAADTTYTATYDVADRNVDVAGVTIDVTGARYTTGNPVEDYGPEVEFAIDTRNPTVSVNIVDTVLNDADNTSSVTFEFSDPVTGFTLDDVTAEGGTLTGFSGSGASYSATFTADDGVEMAGSVSITAGSYTDAAGNPGAGGADTVMIDTLDAGGVELVFSFDVPGVGLVTPDTLVELPPVTSVGVTVTAQVSAAAIGGFQLNFANADVAADELLLHNWTGNAAFLGVDTALNTPTDTFVSAGALTAQNVPVVLGTFQLVTPDVGPGTEFLLTTQYATGNELADTILSNAAGDALPIADFGDVVIRIRESIPPKVSSLTWNTQQVNPADLPKGAQPTSWTQQRSRIRDLTVVFDEPVRPVTAADLVLTNLGGNAPVDVDTVIELQDSQLAMADGNTKLIVSLTAGQLTDGVYELRILPTVKDLAGNTLDGNGDGTGGDAYVLHGNATNKFLKLTGDWNGSGGVNIQDFATFSYWFSTAAPPAPSYVDLNNSGGINIQDFSGFAANFAKGVTYPTAGDQAAGGEASASQSRLFGDAAGGNQGVELVYMFNVPGVGLVTPDTELALPENTTIDVTITAQASPQAVGGFQLNFGNADVAAGELQLHTWTGNAAFLPVDAVLNTPADPFVSGGALTAQNVPLVLGTFKLVTPDVAAASSFLLTVDRTSGNELSDTIIADVTGAALPITNFGDILIRVTADDAENPTVTVHILDTVLSNADNVSSVTFEFSEPVTGFTLEDVTAVGGTVSGLSGSGASYSATFTADDGVEVSGSVSVAADSYLGAAGNPGAGGSDTVVIDTLNPAMPEIAGITTDTGSRLNDGITSDTTLEGYGTGEALGQVQVFLDGISIGQAQADTSGSWTLDHRAHALAEGTYSLTAKVTDAAGNESPASTVFLLNVDLSLPQVAVEFPVADQAYNASRWTDAITGTAADGGPAGLQQVDVSVRRLADGRYWGGSAFDQASEFFLAASGTTAWSLSLPDSQLTDGASYVVGVRATDLAGNTAAGSSVAFAYDITPPQVTVQSLITSDTAPAITGTVSDGTLQVLVHGKTYSAGDGNLVVNGTNWTLQIPASDALTPGIYDVTASATDAAGNVGTDGTAGELVIQAPTTTLAVTALTRTHTGFVAEFNRALQAAGMNVYDQGNLLGPADVTLVGANTGPVTGSVILAADSRSLTFLKTAGMLAPDTYTVILRSGPAAIRDAAGELLDGDGDGTAGGDYVGTFVVAAPPADAITVSLPNMTRGPGQPLNLPADNLTAGLPLTLSNGFGLSGLDLEFHYDTRLLEITEFVLDSDVAAGQGIAQLTFLSPGVARLTVDTSGSLGAAPGLLRLGSFVAAVPEHAAYGGQQVLDIRNLHVYDNGPRLLEVPSLDDDAVHIAAFFGDASGDGWYNSPDATLTRRIIGQINTGLVAYPLTDPVLIVDITHDGSIQSNDTTSIRRAIGLVPVPNIPPLPAAPAAPRAAAADLPLTSPREQAVAAGETIGINNDQACTALDALLVVNDLDAQTGVDVGLGLRTAAGEALVDDARDEWLPDLDAELSPLDSVLDELADDIATAWR